MVDKRGYRGKPWSWWAARQLEHYSERQDARRVESFARTLDEIKALPARDERKVVS